MERVTFVQIKPQLGISIKVGEHLIPSHKLHYKFVKPTTIGIGKAEEIMTQPPIRDEVEYYRIGNSSVFALVVEEEI